MVYDIFLLLGGIGLFLYGISFMSTSLKQAAGDNLRVVLGKLTSNGFFSVLIGIGVTALIQSSGATSVMAVGFVNAGLMELAQAIYVMLGANIGTTITAQIIAFKITAVAPFILFVSAIIILFVPNKTVKKISSVIFGFGLLFVGLYLIELASDALNLETVIDAFLSSVENPILFVIFGMLFTAIIQSSSASVGILQALSISMIAHPAIIYIVIGMNIGACSPVILASIGGSRRVKRTAMACFLAKIFGALIFSVLLAIFPQIPKMLAELTPGNASRQIANFHLLFNLVSTVLVFPLVKLIAAISRRLFPSLPSEEKHAQKLLYIDPEIELTPVIAITQVKREIMRMADITSENLHAAVDAFMSGATDVDNVFEVEKTINFLNHQITAYLIQLHGKSLPDRDLEKVGMMFHVVSDIERIGDHAENIAEYVQARQEPDFGISPLAMDELRNIAEKAVKSVDLAFDVYADERFELIPDVERLEEEVDDLKDALIEHHIDRLKNEQCNPRGGVIFTDMVTDLERVSDHAINIACAINGEKSVIQKKSYVMTRYGNND